MHNLRAELRLLTLLSTAAFALSGRLMQDLEPLLFFLSLLQLLTQILLQAFVSGSVDDVRVLRFSHDVFGYVFFD